MFVFIFGRKKIIFLRNINVFKINFANVWKFDVILKDPALSWVVVVEANLLNH